MNKHNYSHIIIANTNELFLEEVSLLPQDSQEHLLEEYVYAANRAIFYESDNKVIILPRPFDSKLRQKYTQQIGYKNVI